jgi:hypothetical protein
MGWCLSPLCEVYGGGWIVARRSRFANPNRRRYVLPIGITTAEARGHYWLQLRIAREIGGGRAEKHVLFLTLRSVRGVEISNNNFSC